MFLLPKSYLQNTYRKNIDASLYDKCVDRDIVNLSQPDVVGTNISFIILLWEKTRQRAGPVFIIMPLSEMEQRHFLMLGFNLAMPQIARNRSIFCTILSEGYYSIS